MRIMHWLVDELTSLTGSHLFSSLFVTFVIALFLAFVLYSVLNWLGVDMCPFISDEVEKAPEELRDLLLDNYKKRLEKQSIDMDDVEYITDFCLKLQNMNEEALKRAYDKVKKDI